VEESLGTTNVAGSHHFGARDQLLAALLRDAGNRIKTRLRDIVDGWDDDSGVDRFVTAMADAYRDGYGQLALALHMAGWRDLGSGMLIEVIDRMHRRAIAAAKKRRRVPPTRQSIEITVACLHQALVMESAVGHEFRRSVGLSCTKDQGADLVRAWWATVVQSIVDG
jgi:TetR/AcrR family transcriptional regulator, repressor for neighboring sulfatase